MTTEIGAQLDELNKLLTAAVRVLKDAGEGCPASIPLSNGDQLWFGRLGGTYELYVVHKFENGEVDKQRLQNCGRHVRMEAATKLNELRAAILAEVPRYQTQLAEAIASAQAFVERGGNR